MVGSDTRDVDTDEKGPEARRGRNRYGCLYNIS